MPSKLADIFNHGRGKQSGAALLIMLVVLVVGIAAVFVNALSSSSVNTARQEGTSAALAQARDALIGYAVTYGDTHSGEVHGYLPCPDINGSNGEGVSSLSCGSKNVSAIGRLPWKSLDLALLSDGSGECLWYALSGTYKNNPKTDMMNWDNNGQFQVLSASGVILAGQASDSNAVAVVIAPDIALSSLGQYHTPDGTAPICNGNYTASNYLDSDATISANNAAPSTVANAVSQFFAAGATANINDRIIFITKDDIFNAIKKRNDFGTFTSSLLSTTATNLTALPSPVMINFNNTPPTESGFATAGALKIGRVPKLYINPPWDNWQDNLLYATCSGGCLTVNGASCNGVVIFSGERNASQPRITDTQKNTWSNYLEDTADVNLTAFTGGTSFSGALPFSAASPSTDILAACIP